MKHSTFLYIGLAAIAAASLVSSCSDHNDNSQANISFATLYGKSAYRMNASAADFRRDEDLVVFDSASVLIPTDIYGQDISALRDSIISAAFDTVCSSHTDAMNAYFRNVAEELGYPITQLPATEAKSDKADGFAYVAGSVFNLNADRLTYQVTNSVYAPGAAHGLSTSRFLTYDIARSRMISLEDIFSADGLAKLPAIIRGRAEHMASAIGPTDVTALPSQGNFYISLNDEIVFVYQPYEIASYAQGQISIPFQAYQLSDCMTELGQQIFHL